MGCSMSCPLSKKTLRSLTVGQSHDAVSLCKARFHLVKEAVKHRQDFAGAHSRYILSLSSVSSAIDLFVARYSSTPSEFFVTFESSATHQSRLPNSASSVENQVEEKEEEERESGVYEYFVDDFGVNSVETQGVQCHWDFFNVLDDVTESKAKEERECKVELKGVSKDDEQGNSNGRELLEALKDVEDHFLRAFESGMEVSRMLEIDKIPTYPTFENIKDNASGKQSLSSRSSSFKSVLSFSSRSTSSTGAESGGELKSSPSCSLDTSSTSTEHKNDPLDGHWGMASGSHSSTLGRLHAWEKKLYHEVKAAQQIRKIYKQKCSQLQQKKAEGDDLHPSKASEVNDLYHQLLVTVQQAESISKQIEKLRDEELQPQLFELLQGLMRNWNSMSKTHEVQSQIMREINSLSCPEHGKFCSKTQRQATRQLLSAIQAWQSCFSDYVSAQRAYVKSLHGWLSKFIDAEAEYHYNNSFSLPSTRFNGPTLMVTCQRWSVYLERLPDMSLKFAMKSLEKDVQALWVQQGVELLQKRRVDGLDKEMDRKIRTFVKAEDKALVVKYTAQGNVDEQAEYLGEKKKQLDMFKQKVEREREKHQNSMQETERVTLKTLQMGFSSVFESLADFSRASAKVYADLVTLSHNAKV